MIADLFIKSSALFCIPISDLKENLSVLWRVNLKGLKVNVKLRFFY